MTKVKQVKHTMTKLEDFEMFNMTSGQLVRQNDLMKALGLKYTQDILRWRRKLEKSLQMIKIGMVTFYLRHEVMEYAEKLPLPGKCEGDEKVKNYVPMSQAVAITGLSRESIYQLVRSGKLETLNLGKQATLFMKSQLPIKNDA